MRSSQLIRAAAFLPAVVLLAGCGDRSPTVPLDEVPEAFRTEAIPGAGWTRVERRAFSFLLPPGFVDTGLVPIDSDAARYRRDRDGTTLHFDYGPYTGRTRPPDGARGVREVWTRIDGRRVQLVVWRVDDVGTVRAWWPRLGGWTGMEAHLLVGGSFTAAAGRDDLLAAIGSVRFR